MELKTISMAWNNLFSMASRYTVTPLHILYTVGYTILIHFMYYIITTKFNQLNVNHVTNTVTQNLVQAKQKLPSVSNNSEKSTHKSSQPQQL